MQTNGANGHQHEVSEKGLAPGAFPCRLNMEICACRAKRWVDQNGDPRHPAAVHQTESTRRKRGRLNARLDQSPNPTKQTASQMAPARTPQPAKGQCPFRHRGPAHRQGSNRGPGGNRRPPGYTPSVRRRLGGLLRDGRPGAAGGGGDHRRRSPGNQPPGPCFLQSDVFSSS